MTTIAYRDGEMASDTRVTQYDTIVGDVAKLFRTKHGGIIGVAGTMADAAVCLSWAENNVSGPPPERPSESGPLPTAICVEPDGRVKLWNGTPHLLMVVAPFYAIGSGAQVALGAMAMGATAAQAVAAASQFDVYTGGRITSLSLREEDREADKAPGAKDSRV